MHLNAQQTRSSYCKCETVGAKTSNLDAQKDILLTATYSDGSINIKIINNSSEAIYIFNSYFDNGISDSPYLYRYDPKSNTVNISYLPLIPYLTTKYSDKIFLQDRIIQNYQTVYDFYKILPFHQYAFSVKTMNFYNTKDFIRDFDIYALNKFQPIRKFKTKKLKGGTHPEFKVKIAYYKSIDVICNQDAYFLNELRFNDQAKSFKVLSTLLK